MPSDPLSGKRVVILGLARQGTALAEFLAGIDARVTVSDMRPRAMLEAQLADLAEFDIDYVLGDHPASMLKGADFLCLSGGVPLDAPIVQEAVARGIPLSNDAQIFLDRCPCHVIGITGSAGKTTTTALVGAMCEAAGMLPWVGGNIGHPLVSDLPYIKGNDIVVMELSSFQLEIMTTSPHIAAVLNITPNHLDRHKTMEAYTEAKAHILDHQVLGDIAVLNYDEPNAAALEMRTQQEVAWFSGSTPVDVGAWLDGDQLQCRPTFITPMATVVSTGELTLRGGHNVMNALAACAIAGSAEVPISAMRRAILNFTPVPHRLEPVRVANGVTYINDSIATAPERAIAAIRAFPVEKLVMLLGGRDKNLPWDDLLRLALSRSRAIITFGEAGSMIASEATRLRAELGAMVGIEDAHNLGSAVRLAESVAQPGDVVLLSPGCTSYDAYPDFEARGEHFRQLVAAL